MIQESKLKLGRIIGKCLRLTDEEKLIVIKDYLSGSETKTEVYRRYFGREESHGQLLDWMRQLGIQDKPKGFNNFTFMGKKRDKTKNSSDNFELELLKQRIKELESKLETAEMKAIAFSTMVDIAEKEFNIPIRKKYNTKPLK